MSIPRKIGIELCVKCCLPCTTQIFRISHKFLDSNLRSKDLVFCKRECMVEYFEIEERTLDRIEREVQREKRILHRRICPACAGRFVALT